MTTTIVCNFNILQFYIRKFYRENKCGQTKQNYFKQKHPSEGEYTFGEVWGFGFDKESFNNNERFSK